MCASRCLRRAVTILDVLSFEPDPGLFEPVLTAADDAVGFDRPWNPWTLVFCTFFFGLMAGGLALAVNFRRLGLPQHFWKTIWFSALVTAVALTALVQLTESGTLSRDRATQQSVRMIKKALWVICAICIAQFQQRRWRLCMACDEPTARWYSPRLWLMLIGGLILQFVVTIPLLSITQLVWPS